MTCVRIGSATALILVAVGCGRGDAPPAPAASGAPEPSATATVVASVAAPAAPSAATASPFPSSPTNETKDPRARIAHRYTLDRIASVFGAPTWPDKHFDTAPMQGYPKDCDAGQAVACTLAGQGFYRRDLYPLMHKRIFRACELGEPAACGFTLY